ncbi:MAG: DUF4422 domain-containing protein [Prolixibacteraceae bacterium]
MKPDNLQIYVAFHRAGKVVANDSMYMPLQVGRKFTGIELEMQHDAKGENISEKNEVYSELSGWYWIWKNRKHDFVGTAHYRRYFTTSRPRIRLLSKKLLFFIGLKKKRHGLYYVRNIKKWEDKILSANQVQEFMQEYDAILPQKKKFRYTVYEQYKRRHKEKDIQLTRQIVADKYPNYLNAFDETMRAKEMYSFNMFILPWKLFDDYMEWLFTILFELEKRAKIDFSDPYQKRLCAFMAERLQTVWFQKNSLKIKELPVLYFKKMKQH